ncbi:DUF397 domain-containing protein [Streptomyces varsoviensis]|nr:DUF397 domain-containing protein [Streptomyces varsoviensis]
MPPLTWQKSSYSNEGANCIYVAVAPGGTVHIRESDAPESLLTTRPDVLRTLISAIKAGQLVFG